MFSAFQTFGRLGAGARAVAWSPTTLFAAGEAGGLWDFSTLANLYQDSAGTTPCTAVGQPIGKVLDTSGRGNHLTQATSTKRPVLGRMPATGVRNLLTYTEDFSAWSQNVTSVNSNQYTAPDGSLTADELVAGVANASRSQTVVLSASQYTLTFSVRAGTSTAFRFGLISGGWLPASASIVSGSGAVSGTGLMTVTGLDSNWTVISLTATATAASTGFFIYPGPSSQSAGDSIGVWGAQLELGSTATAYQKVGAAYDVTESGVPSVWNAYMDGVDDVMTSPTIDWGGSTTLTHFAGAKSTSTGNYGSFFGNGGANSGGTAGRFAFNLPEYSGVNARSDFGGVATSINISSPLANSTPMIESTVLDSVLSPKMSFRLNGATAQTSSLDVGGQPFVNTVVGIGLAGYTGGASQYKGFISAIIIRGTTTSSDDITSMEKWLAARTPGVTLP